MPAAEKPSKQRQEAAVRRGGRWAPHKQSGGGGGGLSMSTSAGPSDVQV